MGIDLKAGGRIVGHNRRKISKSCNPYIRLLVRLYRFLSRRSNNPLLYSRILRRLLTSKTQRPPLSVDRLLTLYTPKEKKQVAVVSTITSSKSGLIGKGKDLAGVTVGALRFTTGGRAALEKLGAECVTLESLAQRIAGKEDTCVLLKGGVKARTAYKYFGLAPGQEGSHTRPRVRSKGRKFERARGRR